MSEQLQEFFGIPSDSTLVAKIDGVPLYSSSDLKIKFVKSMVKEKTAQPIVRNLIKLMQKNTIIPCWLNKNILQLIGYKIFAPKGIKSIAGFFYPRTEKIYLLIDNNILNLSTLGFTNTKELLALLIHEGMHLYSRKNKSTFLKLFDKELIAYYEALFKKVFDIDSKVNITKDVKVIVSWMFKEMELHNDDIDKAKLAKYEAMLTEAFSEVSMYHKDVFNTKLKEYMGAITLYFKSVDSFISRATSYSTVINSMYSAYGTAFGKKPDSTLCIQELAYPSEVIAILSELRLDSKIYSAFNKI